jgi:hypothetical protein
MVVRNSRCDIPHTYDVSPERIRLPTPERTNAGYRRPGGAESGAHPARRSHRPEAGERHPQLVAQYHAAATDLRDLFGRTPDLTPYDFVPPNVTPPKLSWPRLTSHIDFSEMDSDEVDLRAAIMRSEGLPRKSPRLHRGRKPVAPLVVR